MSYVSIFTRLLSGSGFNVRLYIARRTGSKDTARSDNAKQQLTLDHGDVDVIVGGLLQSRIHVEQVGDVGDVELLVARHHVLR